MPNASPFRPLALALLLLALLQAPGAWGNPLLAMVTATRGGVTVRDGADWKTATLMQPLRQGGAVRLGEGASATLGFVLGGVRVQLQGPCEVEVIASGVRIVKGTPAQVKRIQPAARTALRLAPNDSSLDKMGAVHARADESGLAWVGVSESCLAAPTAFAWRPRSQAKWSQFTLTLWKGLDKEVARVEVPGNTHEARLPGSVRLEAGPTYQLQVSGLMADGKIVLSPRQTFRILAGDEAADIRLAQDEAEKEMKANPQDPTPLILLLTRLDAAELSRDALEVARRIQKLQGTASPAVAAWVTYLHHRLGLAEGPIATMPDLLIQDGHRLTVASVEFSPDGRLLATGGFDGSVHVWDAATGHVVATVFPEGGAVEAVTFSTDRVTLATGNSEGKVALWNVHTGKRIRDLPPQRGNVTCVAFAADGKLVASASLEQGVVVCDVASGRVTRSLAVKEIQSLAFSPDGRHLAGRSKQGDTVILDLSSGQRQTIRAGLGTGVTYVRGGTRLATGSALCDPATGKVDVDLAFKNMGLHTAFSPDGSLLAAAGSDTITFVDAKSRKPVGLIRRPASSMALAWSPDGKLLADARVFPSGQVVVRRVPSGEVLLTLAARADLAAAITLDSTGRYLLVRGGQSRVTLWDLERGRPVTTPSPEIAAILPGAPVPPTVSHGSPPVIYWPDRVFLVQPGGRQDLERVFRFDLPSRTLSQLPSLNGTSCVAMKRDGSVLAAGTEDGRILLLDPNRPKAQPVPLDCGKTGGVTAMAFSPDGRSLAFGARAGTVSEIDLASGRRQTFYEGNNSQYAVDLRYNPDGRSLAFTCLANHLWMWRRGEARAVALPAPPQHIAWTIDFSPDGRLLAAVSGRTITVYDVARGGLPRTLEMEVQQTSMAFVSPRVVATTGSNSIPSISFRDIETGSLLATAMAMDWGKNWVVTTPQGLFDGTADGQRILEWRVGDRLYQLEQFFNDFYTPGLLPRVLSAARDSKRVEPTLDLNRVQPPPRVLIASPANRSSHSQRTIEVRVLVEDQGGGISRPGLYVNGHRAPDSAHRVDNRFHVFKVDLAHGENIIRATAFNGEGKVESRNDRVVVQANLPPPRVTMHVLAVGISRYRCGLGVTSVAAGARATSSLFAPGLFAQVSTTCLVDSQATRAGILAALADIEKKASPDDAVWVYLGGQAIQSGGDYWFLPWDARAQGEEDVQADGLSGAQIAEALTRIRATKQVLVLETSADVPSGTLARLAMRRDAIGAVRAQQRLARSSGTFLVSLSPGGETADGKAAGAKPPLAGASQAEAPGLLVRAIVTGLGGGGAVPAAFVSREGQVTVNALLRYVAESVAQASETAGNRRDVIQSGTGQDFPLRLAPARATTQLRPHGGASNN